MPSQLPDYSDSVRAATARYWEVRRAQAHESKGRGVSDTGIRAEVTGGRHMDALHDLVVSVFVDAGIPAQLIRCEAASDRRVLPSRQEMGCRRAALGRGLRCSL